MRIRISGGLLASVLLAVGLTLPFLILPGTVIEQAGQEGWISILLGTLYGLALTLFVVWLACRFPDRDPLGAISRNVGKWAAFPVRMLYGVWNLFIFVLGLYEAQAFTAIVMLERTPEWVLYGLIMVVVLYAVFQGLEPVVRLTFAAIVPVIVILLLLPPALMREFNILQIDPFLWHGLDGVFGAAIKAAYWLGDNLVILSLMPHLNPKANPYRWTLIGVGVSGLLLALVVALVSLTFGSTLPSRLLYPGFELLAIVTLTEGIERIHVGIIAFGVSASIAKLTFNLWAAVEEGCALFGRRRRTIIMIVLALVGVWGAQSLSGPMAMAELVSHPEWHYFHLAFQMVILLLLAGGTFWAKRRRERTEHG